MFDQTRLLLLYIDRLTMKIAAPRNIIHCSATAALHTVEVNLVKINKKIVTDISENQSQPENVDGNPDRQHRVTSKAGSVRNLFLYNLD